MRIDIDTFGEIAQVLRRNKARTLLTAFGVFWGVFMLLFLLGGGKGFKSLIQKNFDGFASNTSVVFAGTTSKPYKGYKAGRSWNLNYTDMHRIQMMIPEAEIISPIDARWGISVSYEDRKFDNATLKGQYPSYAQVEAPYLLFGRFLNESDILQERKVCVLGKQVYEALFPDGSDPCGKFINVGPSVYQIVGVDIKGGGMNINGPSEQSVVVPLPVVQKVYNLGNDLAVICITAKQGVSTASLESRIRQIIGRAHNFDPNDKMAIVMLNLNDFFVLVDNLFGGINILILLIGIGTILAGAIGVSNIMMVTVRERTTEIGIRRAIGAKPRDILFQIITETVSITSIAGSGGIVFSVLLLNLLEKIVGKGIAFQIDINTALAALGFVVVLGILAGLAPASRAMKIKPVDAMRDE